MSATAISICDHSQPRRIDEYELIDLERRLDALQGSIEMLAEHASEKDSDKKWVRLFSDIEYESPGVYEGLMRLLYEYRRIAQPLAPAGIQ
jgi:hypothetical protein